MNKQIDEFLSEGMKRYKQAAATMVSFGKEIEIRLQKILSERTSEEWWSFVPEEGKKTRSTKYWSEYPLFNAKIDGKIGGITVRITIDINWFESENEYPFYLAWLEPNDPYLKTMSEFDWRHGVYQQGNGIRLDPNEDDFDPERDFGFLLNELVRFFDEQTV